MAVVSMEDLRICQRQRDILQQKLQVHLDRWTLAKLMFEERTTKTVEEHRLKESEHANETARLNLRLGSQEQQLLVLRLQLESAVEDTELREIQMAALKSQLREERKWLSSANKKILEMTSSLPIMASKSKKLLFKAERKVHHMQRLLDERQQSHERDVVKIKEEHTSAVSQLKTIQLLLCPDDDMSVQHKQWNCTSGVILSKLQALVEERDGLRTKEEQWKVDQKELQARLQLINQLKTEQERWNSQQKEALAIMHERDKLLAEKEHYISHKQEMQEVVDERDRLNTQLKHWLAKEKDMRQVEKERDKLEYKLDLLTAQREEEMTALVRERDFVWSQMKIMEENFEGRIKTLSGQILQDRHETQRLRREMQEAQVGDNDEMVEMTILKLEAKRAQDLAIQTQSTFEAELQKVKAENERLVANAMATNSLLLDVTSQKEALEKQLDSSSRQAQEEGAGAVNLEPEVVNVGIGFSQDQEIFESQLEQASQVTKNDDKKSFNKSLEELRREIENLQRENDNLRMLYTELEESHKKKQKPVKLARAGSRRDPTSRNLKLELEAAAVSSPSDESPVSERKFRKMKSPNRHSRNRRLSTRAADSSKPSPGVGNSDRGGVSSQRKTRNSKRRLSSGKDQSSEKYEVSIGSGAPEIPTVDAAADQHGTELLQKRRRKVSSGDSQSILQQKRPLHAIPNNHQSSAKPPAGRSSIRGPSQELENKALPGSVTKTNKMMADLFSSAFSVPRLKTLHRHVGSGT